MKRLNLNDFKTQHTIPQQTKAADQLLGQVLGDCHDNHSSGDRGGYNVGEIGGTNGFN